MSGPIALLKSQMAARWTTLGYPTPLVYDFHEVGRLRDLTAVNAGNGRVIYHWGAYSSPEAAAGEIRNQHAHAKNNGRTVATSPDIFTVHCHGFDPAFPDPGTDGATAAHEDVAWRLLEMFVAALKWVVPKNKWFFEPGPKTLVRDPERARFGELIRLQFTILFSIRADPLFPIQTPVPEPTGTVVPPGGTPTNIVEVP